MKDRRRTAIKPGQQVNFALLEPHTMPPLDAITSVAVAPFTPEGRIVADDLTYMIIFTAFVHEFQPFTPNQESTGRLVLDIEDFLAQYTAADRGLMRSLVTAAHARLFGGA
jgi:hypothetical protein